MWLQVHVHEDAAVRVAAAVRAEAERVMLAAEERVLPAQIEAENREHAMHALVRTETALSVLDLGDEGARLLRYTRTLEDGEAAVWTHHQKLVAEMRQAVFDAEQHATQTVEDLLSAEIGQREAIQACVLAERKAADDKTAWELAEKRLYDDTFTQERADA